MIAEATTWPDVAMTAVIMLGIVGMVWAYSKWFK